MALDQYQKKRDFRKTPEPQATPAKSGRKLSYVVQKHDASHLHYDFRLELDGVLKSWAVPKGPSLDPAVKRLAVQVEDHPLEYRHFEGEIPAGEYGAGHVIVWDQGRWIPQGDPQQGWRDGHLKFRLEGTKLSGNWALVRMGAPKAEKENWLLIKERDAEAASNADGDITELRPESVLAGTATRRKEKKRSVADSANPRQPDKSSKAAAKASSRMTAKPAPKEGRKSTMPAQIAPQLATLTAEAPAGDDWLAEIKFDGYRALCRIEHGEARLLTRAGHDWSGKWPAITAAAARLPVAQAWLDGEVVAIGPDGAMSFQLLQNMTHAGDDASAQGQFAYYVFDLLYLDGHDLRQQPLLERKRLLQVLLGTGAGGPLRYSDHVRGNTAEVFSHACMHGLEGIIAKQGQAAYVSTRSRSWLKIKCHQRQEFVIGGYTDPAGQREKFGALLLGVHDADGQLRYAGKVGTGFDVKTLHTVARAFPRLASQQPPFVDPPKGAAAAGAHWLRPQLVAEVQFAAWTHGGAVRHASFVGLRNDKPASEIIREQAVSLPTQATPSVSVPAQAAQPPLQTPRAARGSSRPRHAGKAGAERSVTLDGITLTHPSRLLFPQAGITKLDLARYYHDIADWILPHLAQRPLTLVRCPQGAGAQCFFQKHASATTAADIPTVAIPGGSGEAPYMMANSLPALLALVQMGVLELHTWGARAGALERPDRIIFDLDPAPDVPWTEVIVAAQLIHARMDQIGLRSFVKTTGGKGLHVVIPLYADKSWDQIKEFSRAVPEQLADAFPDRFTAQMAKNRRVGKIFIDYLRNAAEATAVVAYSTRARDGAPVSTPLAWDELAPELRSDSFNLHNIPARLKTLKQDPWADYFSSRQRLTAKIQRLLVSG